MRLKPRAALDEIAGAIDTSFGMRSEYSVSGLFKSRPVVVEIAPPEYYSSSYTGEGLTGFAASIAFDLVANALPKQDFSLKIRTKCESPITFETTMMFFGEEVKFGSQKRWISTPDQFKPACRSYFNNPDVNECVCRLLVEQKMLTLQKTFMELILDCEIQQEYEGVYDALDLMWWLSDALERVPVR